LVAVTTDKDAETSIDETSIDETSAAEEITEPSGDVEVTDAEVTNSDDAESGDTGDGDRDGTAGTAEDQADPPRRTHRLLVAVLSIALVAALAGAGYLGWRQWQTHQVTAASTQAQQAAEAYAAILTSIDSTKVDENFQQVLDGATGEFKDMYSQSSAQLRQLLIDNKATAHGVVIASAVQSATKDKVVVLLFVDQSVSNTQVPDPRIDRSRIKMTMEHVDGRWRASKVELP
jgi:Mce-associated membrane protein